MKVIRLKKASFFMPHPLINYLFVIELFLTKVIVFVIEPKFSQLLTSVKIVLRRKPSG
jgi:hypothetical protein